MTTKKQIITEKTEEEIEIEKSREKALGEIRTYFGGYVPSKANMIKEKVGEAIKRAFDKGVSFGKQEQKKEELEFLLSLQGVLRTNKESSMKLDNRIKQLEGVKR